MARRHGWQLPAHTFQVVAITVFFLLSVAFYAFFAPFLGKDLYEDVAIGVYTCLAFSVFILYVRCTGIDPADPGILVAFDETSAFRSCNKPDMSMSAASLGQPGLKTVAEFTKDDRSSSCSNIGCFFCSIIVKDDCRGEGEDMDNLPQQTEDEDALFCTLCNAEVQKHSKHCRSCDKCVDGFDHHCRWLNNCVGKKNYVSFFSLMAVSLVWLMVECAVGISVLTRCFTDKKGTKNQIYDRLGNGFSLVPFATVVGLCTIVSLVALIPLAELFFFHMILIKKGITTYEYVVAMRVQSEPPGPSLNGDQQSLPSSPGSLAATTLSGRSSLGIHHKGAWCTPPRIFIDHQDEVVPHLGQGRVPSTVDPDVMQCHKGKRVSKPPVRISAWRLAKLNSEEAIRAGAKARASSSVLRPISSRNPYDTDRCSSERSSAISLDIGYGKDRRIGMTRSSRKSSYPPSRASRDDIEAYAQSQSSFGSPYPHGSSSIALSPPLERDSNRDRLNQVYESSASQSPRSVQTGDGNGSGVMSYFDPMMDYRRYNGGGSDHLIPSSFLEGNTRNISIRAIQSTFLGSFIPNEEMARSDAYGSKTSSSNNHQVRAERGSQLPVFVSRDSQMNHFSIFP